MNPSNLTPNQLNSYHAFMEPQQSPATGNGDPNFVEKLLPTAGSILGGIGGTFLDPITAGLGTVGGSALGSAAGQGLENLLTGHNDSLLGAGAEGAAGGVLGALGGKVLGGGFKLLGKAAGNLADRQAGEAATNAFAQDFPKAAFNNKLLDNLGVNNSKQTLEGIGVAPTAGNFNDVGKATTQILNTHLTNALADSGPVDINPLQATIKNELDHYASAVGENPDAIAKGRLTAAGNSTSALRGQLNNIVQGIGLNGEGSLTGTADASQVRQLVGALQKEAQNAKPIPDVNTGVVDPALQARYNVLNNTANQARSLLYDRPQFEAAAAKLQGNTTPADISAITEGRISGREAQAVADHINSTVTNAQSGNELLQPYSNAINMKKAGEIATNFKDNVAPIRPVEAAASNEQMLSPDATVAAQLAHPKLAKVASVLNYIGNVAAKPAAAASDKLAAAASSAPGKLPLGLPGFGVAQLAAHTPSLGSDNTNANPSVLGSMGAENTMNPYQTNSQPSGIPMGWAMLNAPDFAKTAQASQTAQPILNSLEQSYAHAGGAQGTGGGMLSALSGLIPGTGASQYNAQKLQAAAAIAHATGMPLQTVLAALPSLMADRSGAMNDFQGIQGALGAMQGNPSAVAAPSVLSGLAG